MALCLCGHPISQHNEWGCKVCHCFQFETEEMARRSFQQYVQELSDAPDRILDKPVSGSLGFRCAPSEPVEHPPAWCSMLLLLILVVVLCCFLIYALASGWASGGFS